MTRREFRIHPEVEADVAEIVGYLRESAPEQVECFSARLVEQLRIVRRHSEASPALYDRFRHIVVRPFSYMVIYTLSDTLVGVVSVIHMRRDPAWIEAEVEGRTFE